VIEMRAAIVVVVGLVGCGREHGVVLEVTMPAGVGSAELLIAPNECKAGEQVPACDSGVAWDTAKAKAPGTVFILGHDDAITTPVDGNVARFQLEPGGRDDAQRLAVIGYHGATVAGVALLQDIVVTDRAEVWKADLQPLPDIGP